MKLEIKNRFTKNTQFTAEIDRGEDATISRKIGLAVKCAVKNSANLSGADISGANLTGADLTDAYLTGANLSGAVGVVPLGTPDGWTAVGWWKDGDPWVCVGCRNKSLSDGKSYWANKPDRREVMAALEYFEAVAAIRGQLSEKPNG